MNKKKLNVRAKRLALARAANLIRDERNKDVTVKTKKKRRCGCRGRR